MRDTIQEAAGGNVLEKAKSGTKYVKKAVKEVKKGVQLAKQIHQTTGMDAIPGSNVMTAENLEMVKMVANPQNIAKVAKVAKAAKKVKGITGAVKRQLTK